MQHPTYEESFQIRSSEVHPNRRMKLQSLCDLMQEVAGKHALQLNFGISDLQEKKLTWILHRLHVIMNRYPEWQQNITIKTWPSSGDALRAYRDFQIMDDTGMEIGRALSYWLLINTESRRPVRMPKQVLEMAPENIEHVLNIRKDRISLTDRIETSKSFHVRKSDLDLNGHANNVRFIDWALEVIPRDTEIREIDIEFRAECTYGDTVVSEVSVDDTRSSHVLRKEDTGQVVAAAVTHMG